MQSISYKIVVPSTWNSSSYEEFMKGLFLLKDEKYLEFNKKITPTSYKMIGIKVPILREISKNIKKTDIYAFLENTKGKYFEEIILEGLVIGYITDYDVFVSYFRNFLKRIDNWAVCDICISSFQIIKKNKATFINIVDKLISSNNPFDIRVGVVILLNHYRKDDSYLEYFYQVIDKIVSNDYYVEMAIAWFLSFLFIDYRDRTLIFLEKNHLSKFTQNKAISKIRDSLRVNKEDKELILKYKK